MADSREIKAFIAACRRVAGIEPRRFSSGNMSCRLSDGTMAVTVKGAWLGLMDDDHVAVCRIEDGECIKNGKTPSVESRFHAGVLRTRSDVNVVLHCQSPCATAVACGNPVAYNFAVIPEIPFYIGTPAIVEYMTPGSVELADAIIKAMASHDLVVLRNHGQVVTGRTFDDAIQKAGFFELACEILLHGKDICPLPAEGIESLRARSARERESDPGATCPGSRSWGSSTASAGEARGDRRATRGLPLRCRRQPGDTRGG